MVRFVDTYRDPNAETEEEENFAGDAKKAPWWAFWKSGKSGANTASKSDFQTPTEWVKTDLHKGLDNLEVERRRKQSGWNELAAEKENMLIKFIGFFRGPVLYGKQPPSPQIDLDMYILTTPFSHGSCFHPCPRSPGLA